MQRPADTTYPIHELLRARWSPVSFDPRPLPPALLARVLEAARWAPSSYNEQPWHFIVAPREDQAAFERLAACLVDANRAWAASASVLMLGVAKLRFDRNGKENRHAFYDVGQAVAHLSVEATAAGLFVHQMAGFDADQARELCEIPTSHEAISAIALGYYGTRVNLPEDLRQRDQAPRQRKALAGMVSHGKWSQPLALPTPA